MSRLSAAEAGTTMAAAKTLKSMKRICGPLFGRRVAQRAVDCKDRSDGWINPSQDMIGMRSKVRQRGPRKPSVS